jgi:hypothetical protein
MRKQSTALRYVATPEAEIRWHAGHDVLHRRPGHQRVPRRLEPRERVHDAGVLRGHEVSQEAKVGVVGDGEFVAGEVPASREPRLASYTSSTFLSLATFSSTTAWSRSRPTYRLTMQFSTTGSNWWASTSTHTSTAADPARSPSRRSSGLYLRRMYLAMARDSVQKVKRISLRFENLKYEFESSFGPHLAQ